MKKKKRLSRRARNILENCGVFTIDVARIREAVLTGEALRWRGCGVMTFKEFARFGKVRLPKHLGASELYEWTKEEGRSIANKEGYPLRDNLGRLYGPSPLGFDPSGVEATVNGKKAKPGRVLKDGQQIEIKLAKGGEKMNEHPRPQPCPTCGGTGCVYGH